MRPCNQCRRPVENNVVICDACKDWNAAQRTDSGNKQDELGSEQGGFDRNEVQGDYSYAILMGAFSLVITGLFALIGMLIYGFDGFMAGGAVGLVVGVVLFSVAIKM